MVAGWSLGSEEVISTAETARDTRLVGSQRLSRLCLARRCGLFQQHGVRLALAALFELCFLTASCHLS
jgi:hypothetical protein